MTPADIGRRHPTRGFQKSDQAVLGRAVGCVCRELEHPARQKARPKLTGQIIIYVYNEQDIFGRIETFGRIGTGRRHHGAFGKS